ncbi:DMT family transporter [Sabulicella rubraurantiaca]|uniref:DMT family transporter n=1 Tax=Sabulicella rubraurantiaca TaxID=2811429 RepID=UPI001A9768B3|nr:DMT family transporter [Sabulicella rubraurantiaca]
MKEAKPAWLPLAPFLFVLLWSGGFTAVKAALPYAEALTLQAVRYVCVVAILLPLWLVLRPPVPDRATLTHLVRMGLVVQFGYFAAMNLGQQFGMGPGAIALIIGLQPVVVALLAPAVAGDPPVGARGWAGLVLGLLGAAMVILSGSGISAGGWLGLFFSVLALVLMAAGALMERRGGRPCDLVTANLVMCGVALVATLPMAWGVEAMRVRWTWEFVAALAYLVLVNSLISLSLLFLMLRHGEAARASSVFFLVPPVAAAIAWVVLGAAMTPLAMAGTAVAAVGVALVVARR